MTDRLRRALADAGAAAPMVDLYEQALADGRRLRRRRNGRAALGATIAVLLAVAMPGALLGAGSEPGEFPAAGGIPSLPDRISTSWPWTATVEQAPAGPAALLINQELGMPSSVTFPEDTIAAVGATANTYRTLDSGGRMRLGADGLLSPDGNRLVEGAAMHDLVTGRSYALPGVNATTQFVPLAWAPDSGTLAVIRETGQRWKDWLVPEAATVGLLDLASGDYRPLLDVTAQLDAYLGTPAHMAAFTPDGSRLAVQFGDKITVFTRDATTWSSFVLSHDSQLAGKGAFTPDGRWIAVVSRAACCSDQPGQGRFPSQWRIRLLDPATGAERPGWSLSEVSGVTALRLIGWWPSGEAVVAAFYPHPGSSAQWNPATADPNHDQWGFPNYYEQVDRVEVRALATGGGSRELLSLPDTVYGVDIAENILAHGVVRPGGDAPVRPVRTGWLVTTAAVAILLTATPVTVVLLIRRLRRPGRSSRQANPARPAADDAEPT
ncbi:hypothetical protein GCM10022225_25220 [Plantactinospora mayteni]|uniref:WD40 repeat domain-containing protein n=1 Tax=Plantactinospora mayteni TaxID=566021 RepID=A0ABQ4EJ17_9ACTN|nr:hypothetical protein [Plantactinospora mayteni]GIG94748.1 hypothetical protein Pma05_13210 [Plantactinospora mayteni]